LRNSKSLTFERKLENEIQKLEMKRERLKKKKLRKIDSSD